MEQLYGLLGHPVHHSISPLMHNGAFKKLKIHGHYMSFDISKEKLEEGYLALKTLNFKGFNVTIPHKETIMKYLDVIDTKAKEIGAINTVVYKENQWIGYNTDLEGFLLSLDKKGISLTHKKVCVLGHGGASKAIVYGCIEKQVGMLDVFSRDLNRVDSWFKLLEKTYARVNIKSYNQYSIKNDYDLIINTTPLGMLADINKSVIDASKAGHKNTIFYDLIYNPSETLFLKQGKLGGRQGINGLDMLIYQGIAALQIWLPEEDIKTLWTREDVLKIIDHLV